jgi:hypothetical protein
VDNERYWSLPDVPRHKTVREIEKDLARLKAHLNKQDGGPELVASVENTVKDAAPGRALIGKLATDLDSWLDQVLPVMDEDEEKAENQFDRIRSAVRWAGTRDRAGDVLTGRTPVFVYFSQFFSVRPRSVGQDGHILVFGSRTLWNDLLAHNLVDALHHMVGPSSCVAGHRRSQRPLAVRCTSSRCEPGRIQPMSSPPMRSFTTDAVVREGGGAFAGRG